MLHQQSQEIWLLCGNFNEVMSHDEKWGGKQKVNNLLMDFLIRENDCELADLGFEGPKFSWCNNLVGEAYISKRLD